MSNNNKNNKKIHLLTPVIYKLDGSTIKVVLIRASEYTWEEFYRLVRKDYVGVYDFDGFVLDKELRFFELIMLSKK